jgi:Plasmid pRiA4b ORF-3-like protein
MPNDTRSKRICKATSVVLRIELCDIEPLIWRRIVVPTSWPMSTLHRYVQWVMGWQDTHAHEFRIGDQIVAPDWWIEELSLDPDTGNHRNERRVKVATVVSEAAPAGEFEYAYDMGDGWRHRLVVETDSSATARQFDRLPLCTAGENACPPDDVGGPHGYARFLAALADPEDEDYATMMGWIGGVFDPRGFDLNRLNREWRVATAMGQSR